MRANLILSILTAFLPSAAALLRVRDENSIGTDDYAADVIVYANDVLTAVLNKQPVPYPPDSILTGPKEAQLQA